MGGAGCRGGVGSIDGVSSPLFLSPCGCGEVSPAEGEELVEGRGSGVAGTIPSLSRPGEAHTRASTATRATGKLVSCLQGGKEGPHVYVRTYVHLLALQCLAYKHKRSQRKEVPRSTAPPPPSLPSLPSSQWYLQPKQQLHTDRLGRLGQLAGVAGKAEDPNVLDGRGTIRGRGNAYRGCAELTNNTKGSCDQSGSH